MGFIFDCSIYKALIAVFLLVPPFSNSFTNSFFFHKSRYDVLFRIRENAIFWHFFRTKTFGQFVYFALSTKALSKFIYATMIRVHISGLHFTLETLHSKSILGTNTLFWLISSPPNLLLQFFHKISFLFLYLIKCNIFLSKHLSSFTGKRSPNGTSSASRKINGDWNVGTFRQKSWFRI